MLAKCWWNRSARLPATRSFAEEEEQRDRRPYEIRLYYSKPREELALSYSTGQCACKSFITKNKKHTKEDQNRGGCHYLLSYHFLVAPCTFRGKPL